MMPVNYFYTLNYEKFKFYKAFKAITLTNIVILSLLILLGIKKGTIISLGTVCLVVFGIIFAVKKLTGKSFMGNIIPQRNKVLETNKSANSKFSNGTSFVLLLLFSSIFL